MSRRIGIILALFALIGVSAPFAARADEEVAVIVNRDNPASSLSGNDVRKIYTNGILRWPDGAPITIYDLSVMDPLRAVFSEAVLGKPPDRVAEEWAHLKITNQAKNPPTALKSEAFILRRVSVEKGAIGYVSLNVAKRVPGLVKIIMTIP